MSIVRMFALVLAGYLLSFGAKRLFLYRWRPLEAEYTGLRNRWAQLFGVEQEELVVDPFDVPGKSPDQIEKAWKAFLVVERFFSSPRYPYPSGLLHLSNVRQAIASADRYLEDVEKIP